MYEIDIKYINGDEEGYFSITDYSVGMFPDHPDYLVMSGINCKGEKHIEYIKLKHIRNISVIICKNGISEV